MLFSDGSPVTTSQPCPGDKFAGENCTDQLPASKAKKCFQNKKRACREKSANTVHNTNKKNTGKKGYEVSYSKSANQENNSEPDGDFTSDNIAFNIESDKSDVTKELIGEVGRSRIDKREPDTTRIRDAIMTSPQVDLIFLKIIGKIRSD